MIYDLELEISGDCWSNALDLRQKLDEFNEKAQVTIDLRSEGPCLSALGITDTINQWCIDTKRQPESVTLSRWNNPVEWVPYRLEKNNQLSHFFPMSLDYWHNRPPIVTEIIKDVFLFGFFVGRLTPARSAILFDVGTTMKSFSLTSLMSSRAHWPWDVDHSKDVQLEKLSDWMPMHQQMRMIRWYLEGTVKSIDGFSVQDQFVSPTSYADTNVSLNNYYDKFAIELVAETYTLGNTFFPTEKTVRPIMARKPVLIYGPRYYLARLKELGFKTWNELWDESYDLLEGPARWQAIRQTMFHIKKSGFQRQHEILTQAQTICQHNREKLLEIIGRSRVVPNSIWL